MLFTIGNYSDVTKRAISLGECLKEKGGVVFKSYGEAKRVAAKNGENYAVYGLNATLQNTEIIDGGYRTLTINVLMCNVPRQYRR